jgi:8-oxo-dGTP diphosphatase
MTATKNILKVGLASVRRGRLLVVRKFGMTHFILPGGKPERGEQDLETLRRELNEELGCTVSHIRFEGAFTDVAAELIDTVVTIRLFAGRLRGPLEPASEIEELAWVKLDEPPTVPLAPSITNQILPYLSKTRMASAGQPPL